MRFSPLFIRLSDCISLLIILVLVGCFVPVGVKDREQQAALRKAEDDRYNQREAVIQEQLKTDSAYIKLLQSYDVFPKWETDDYEIAVLIDSVHALQEPFFDRIHVRYDSICGTATAETEELKELRKLFEAFYGLDSSSGKYFVEHRNVRYRTTPCSHEDQRHGACAYKNVPNLCVDGGSYKRLILSDDDIIAINLFLKYNPTRYWELPEDYESRTKALPIPVGGYAEYPCCTVGEIRLLDVYLNLAAGEASIEIFNMGCDRLYYKKVGDSWLFDKSEITCWI